MIKSKWCSTINSRFRRKTLPAHHFLPCARSLDNMKTMFLEWWLKVGSTVQIWNWSFASDFWVAFGLCFKASPSAKSFIRKLILFTCKFGFIYMWIKLIFIWKVLRTWTCFETETKDNLEIACRQWSVPSGFFDKNIKHSSDLEKNAIADFSNRKCDGV